MQITLEQPEIKLALRQYVNSMFTMKNGTKMDIEFSATRGSAGIVAKIDIVHGPAVAAQPVTREITKEAAVETVRSAPVVIAQATVAPAPVSHTVEAEAPVVTDAVLNEETGVVEQADAGNESSGPAPGEVTEGAGSAPATPPKVSLFGGLKRPSNKS